MFHIRNISSSREDNGKNLPQEILVDVSNRTLIRIILLVLITLLLIGAFMKITHALLLIFVAFFLAIALNNPVSKIAQALPGKRRGSRAVATTISFLAVVLLLGAFASYIIPPLVHQTERFISAAPGLVQGAKNQNSSLGQFIRHYHLEGEVNTLSSQISARIKGISGSAFSSIGHILGSIFSMLAVLALTFMMLVEGPRWARIIKQLFIPKKHDELLTRTIKDMYEVVRGYVNGQVLLAFIAAVLIAPALILLHISYPIALMVVVFLAGLIPVIGHTIGAVIVGIVALFHSVPAAIIILIYYIIYMQVENYLLQPRIQANTTNMSPLLVLASVIIGVSFGGLLGGLVAIPLAGCLRVAILEYLDQKNLMPEGDSANSHDLRR
jgi:predicted PurR-regulated permease PerM